MQLPALASAASRSSLNPTMARTHPPPWPPLPLPPMAWHAHTATASFRLIGYGPDAAFVLMRNGLGAPVEVARSAPIQASKGQGWGRTGGRTGGWEAAERARVCAVCAGPGPGKGGGRVVGGEGG